MAQKFIQAQKFALAGSGVTSTATSITLQSFQTPDGTNITSSDIGTTNYGTFEPGGTKEEIFSFTGVTQNANGTATLTGVTRGLKFVSPYDADTALRQSHAGGTVAVLSNNPQLYENLLSADNNEIITGDYTFNADVDFANNLPTIPTTTPTSDDQVASKKYVDDTAIAGAPDASTTTKGISKLSTAAASPTNPIAVGDNDTRVPTQDENDALAGTDGSPSSSNKYVTEDDVAENTASKVIRRKSDSNITVPTTPTTDTDATSKGYVDSFSPLVSTSTDQTLVTLAEEPTETTFHTESIAGNLLGTGNVLRISGLVNLYNISSSFSNSAIVHFYYGGTKIGSSRFNLLSTLSSGQISFVAYIYANGSTNSQRSYVQTISDNGDDSNASAQVSTTVDSTTSQDFVLKGSRQSSNAGPQAAIDNLLVEIIR